MKRLLLGLLLCWAAPPLVHAAPAAPVTSTATPARQQLEEVLAHPAFHRWQRRQQRVEMPGREFKLSEQSWLQWFRDTMKETLRGIGDGVKAFFRWIGSLFRNVNPPRMPNLPDPTPLLGFLRIAGWAAVGVVGALLLYLLYRLLREGGAWQRQAAPITRERLVQALRDGDALVLDDQGWLDHAQQLAEDQDFRASYRALYLALLSGLHRRRWIDFRAQRTNWTYVRLFRGPQPQRGSFADLTELFDSVWYGRREPPAGAQRLHEMRQAVEQLTREQPDAA